MDPIEQEDPELWVRDYIAMSQDLGRKAEEAQERFAEIEGEGRNDYVRLTVNSGGVIQSVTFSSNIRSIGAEELSDRFMDAYSVAITAVNGQTESFIRSINGDEDPAMADYVRDIVPHGMRERAERVNQEQQR